MQTATTAAQSQSTTKNGQKNATDQSITRLVNLDAIEMTKQEIDLQMQLLREKKKALSVKGADLSQVHAVVGDFKGKPQLVIQLKPSEKFNAFTDFSFGLTKARMILAVLPAIQKFVADNQPK